MQRCVLAHIVHFPELCEQNTQIFYLGEIEPKTLAIIDFESESNANKIVYS
jgi:hypothetical protein